MRFRGSELECPMIRVTRFPRAPAVLARLLLHNLVVKEAPAGTEPAVSIRCFSLLSHHQPASPPKSGPVPRIMSSCRTE